MIWLVIVLVAVLVCFTAVLLVGAPYLPTLQPQLQTALKLAALRPGDTLLELGCGDGKVVLAAAKQGIKVVGYELNPILALIAWLRTRRYHLHAQIVWGNFWQKPWPEAAAIFTFLLPKYMKKLDTQIRAYNHRPVRLVSFAFAIPDRKAVSQKDGVYLYVYK